MTGFARASSSSGNDSWSWEIKSTNSRGLDLRCRLQGGLDELESSVRAAVTRRFRRGALTLNLNFTRSSKKNLEMKVNEGLLNTILDVSSELAQRLNASPPSIEGLLSIRGVLEIIEVEAPEEDHKELKVLILSTLEEALDALADDRGAEGKRLVDILDDQVNTIYSLTNKAASLVSNHTTILKSRMQHQISELVNENNELSEDRLLQEVALLAIKQDVREELDRLSTHVKAAKELLDQGGVIGRRLDFLAQEFNREANTLCSKSQDVALTKIGIELKTVIDQLREQAQNIE